MMGVREKWAGKIEKEMTNEETKWGKKREKIKRKTLRKRSERKGKGTK